MKVRRLTAVLALAFSFLAFVALAETAAAVDPVTITIAAQNNSGQAGTATLTDMGNGTTKVVVSTSNPTAAAQPIHIHEGTCANVNRTVKFPLTTTANGQSETTINAALADLLASPHVVNIHKSAQEASIYVACGDIAATAPTGGVMPSAAPRTGGGGMAQGSSPLVWGAVAALLTVTVAGATYALRRRAA